MKKVFAIVGLVLFGAIAAQANSENMNRDISSVLLPWQCQAMNASGRVFNGNYRVTIAGARLSAVDNCQALTVLPRLKGTCSLIVGSCHH